MKWFKPACACILIGLIALCVWQHYQLQELQTALRQSQQGLDIVTKTVSTLQADSKKLSDALTEHRKDIDAINKQNREVKAKMKDIQHDKSVRPYLDTRLPDAVRGLLP